MTYQARRQYQELMLQKIVEERGRQDAKFGVQSHSDLCPVLSADEPPTPPAGFAEDPEVPTAMQARKLCQREFGNGRGSWGVIITEEFAEVIDAAARRDPDDLETELVQLAAVCVAWLEDLKTRSN